MRYLIVADLHGRHDLARGILTAEHVPLTAFERRAAGVWTVQLGDLANCVVGSHDSDLAILTVAADWFDTVLVGNHEHPYLGGGAFSGFQPFRDIEERLHRLDTLGILQPCLRIGDTLLTHAGVTPDWRLGDARDARDAISACWRADRAAPVFNQVGRARCGGYRAPHGWPEHGGILWSDWAEPREDGFNQIHGHTPVKGRPIAERWKRWPPRWALNLDAGACFAWRSRPAGNRVVAAWIGEDGEIDGDLIEYTVYAAA